MPLQGCERDERWWKCKCGAYLPSAPGSASGRGTVKCVCGCIYEFGYWRVTVAPGIEKTTGLEPRLIVDVANG